MSNAENLISNEMESLFNGQMQKLLPVVEYLDYVKDGVVDYSRIFGEKYTVHKPTV